MSQNKAEFEFLRNWAKDKAALDLGPEKDYLVDARISALLKVHNIESFTKLTTDIKNARLSDVLKNDLIDAFTTHETSFFRDIHPFEFLKNSYLPKWFNENPTENLNIWSAACSTGQEIYSLSILLAQNFPQIPAKKLRFYGTDISVNAINRAKKGLYNQVEIGRGLPASLLVKYFKQNSDKMWKLNDSICNKVSFDTMNLAKKWPPLASFDIIFLRNVMIYFNIETKVFILNQIKQTLKSGGILFLGGSETTLNIDPEWELVRKDKTSYYRLKS